MSKNVRILCDLTQSWSETGGGIRTYLTEKRDWLTRHTPHRHILIVPGDADRVTEDGRHITVEIESPRVPGSPMYRLLLRNRSVIRALRYHQPGVVECLDAYNLPWAALAYRKERPNTVLVAGYRTDFPEVYLDAPLRKRLGGWAGAPLGKLGYRYAARLYRKFDGMYALGRPMADKLANLTGNPVDVLPLGVDTKVFSPAARDPELRAAFGVGHEDPLLVYAGRLDGEKQGDVILNAFAELPRDMKAGLVLLGIGNLLDELRDFARERNLNAHFPGFVSGRADLARHLASADLYVSAMAHETFGISIIEAQSCGLPVIGVRAGAMPDRVSPDLGRLGPVGDASAMAASIRSVWESGKAIPMAAAARKHVEDNFSWDRTFDHLFGTIYAQASRSSLQRRGLDVQGDNTLSLMEVQA
ncbi:MAG: glycosyltransferase [Planctomycetota bacterium]